MHEQVVDRNRNGHDQQDIDESPCEMDDHASDPDGEENDHYRPENA